MTSANANRHPWSSEGSFNKALLYVGKMESADVSGWEFALWAGLALEHLSRAALAHVSPVLLADRKDWRNSYFALGHVPPSKGSSKTFRPSSIGTAEILSVLHEIIPEFHKEHLAQALRTVDARNAELHTADASLLAQKNSKWLPGFYAVCQVLIASMGKTLQDLFVDSKRIADLIEAYGDQQAKAVLGDIGARRRDWENLPQAERDSRASLAASLATRYDGHRASCPACASTLSIAGEAHGSVKVTIDDDTVRLRQAMLPMQVRCVACGLRIHGYSRLAAAGLGDVFTSTVEMSVSEYLAPADEDGSDYFPEEDFND